MQLSSFHNPAPRCWWLAAAVLWLLVPATLGAAEPVDFNREIRPLLSNHCLVCHGPDEAERAADLRLDTEVDAKADLGGYAAVVPGKPEESELYLRITSDDPFMRMPPPSEGEGSSKGQGLSEKDIALLRRWIEQGGNYERHWSYQKPVQPELPKVQQQDWPRNPIDHFVLARLEQEGLQPSPAADRLTLARRVALDLTGLPPTWQEAHEFAEDPREEAYELFVDKQLAKQSFGERWARVWLDLARYADSAGYADDPPRTIWAYRDYVIRSLNENKPFDQFTIEQIAGDLLPNPTEQQRVATAFHRNTLTNNEGGTNDEEFRNVAIVDRVNTTMAVWMGTTMACAQCHTHKYDPITQHEYFQFFDFFNQTADADKRDERPTIDLWSQQQEQQKQRLKDQIQSLEAELEKETPQLREARQQWIAQFTEPPDWTTLKPIAANATHGTLEIKADGTIAANGEEPATDRYEVTLPLEPNTTISGLRLEVPPAQQENFVLSSVEVTWQPEKHPASEDQTKAATDARFVRVDLPGESRILHLAELEVFSGDKNIALEGEVTQSSTDYGGKASHLIDGNSDGDFSKESVTHTAKQENPWVEIDLGSVQSIDRLVIWNRTDGGDSIRNRLKGYEISLLDADRKPVWHKRPDDVPSPKSVFRPDGRVNWRLAAAHADHQQDGFPANSVLEPKVDPKRGWAIAPQTGKAHELILSLDAPKTVPGGSITVALTQRSNHSHHLLRSFRLAKTSDPSVSRWATLPADVQTILRTAADQRTDQQRKRLAEHHRTITPLLDEPRGQLESARKQLTTMKPYTSVPVMQQLAEDQHRETHVQIRGNYQSIGDRVEAGTPSVFPPLPDDLPVNRLALAHWLVDEDNPLTSRVIANRHWEQLFGVGIVETSEEFGSQGELPSHPQLLDWLAVELQQSGWDLKHLLKLMVMSATYRQSSVTNSQLQQLDPQNRLLARGPRFRVSAEMVRDQALFVSGLLSEQMFGPPVKPPQPELGLKAAFGSATDWKTSSGADRYRRGLYTTWRRSSPYPSMAQFDAPNREVCTVRRIRTNTPLQALVTLNDPVYVEAAQALARRMIEHADDPEARIDFAFRHSLIRPPSVQETARLKQLASDAYQRYRERPEEAKQMATVPRGPLPEDADLADYAAWTVVGNVILNLDEMFLKR